MILKYIVMMEIEEREAQSTTNHKLVLIKIKRKRHEMEIKWNKFFNYFLLRNLKEEENKNKTISQQLKTTTTKKTKV